MIAVDSNVLVAAFDEDHPHHVPSFAVVRDATPQTHTISAHSMAECYAVLTRLPVRPRNRPDDVLRFLEDVRARFRLVQLSGEGYMQMLAVAAEKEAVGGAVYDLLIMACAKHGGARVLYTWNEKHFSPLEAMVGVRVALPHAA